MCVLAPLRDKLSEAVPIFILEELPLMPSQTHRLHHRLHRSEAEWLSGTYLQHGSPREQGVWRLMDALCLHTALHEHSPTLVGTIPLGIELPESDVDIICEVSNHAAFRHLLIHLYGQQELFEIHEGHAQGRTVTVCSFSASADNGVTSVTETVEIFGQCLPIAEQNGFRHLVAEARLLATAQTLLDSDDILRVIRTLKAHGIKTEPAFALAFKLAGDPYQTLLELYNVTDEELTRLVERTLLNDSSSLQVYRPFTAKSG
jgi:hypothetical protein